MLDKQEVISLEKLKEYHLNFDWNIYIEKINFCFSANIIKESDEKQKKYY